ncbi:PHP domain-containing protein [Candidatus Dependentiae bacterium]|nr:PHP domain-containing protein [Candidatus Dependentiae bacterium]
METKKYPYDLHIHTTISDGTFPPEKLIKHAFDNKIKGISITDHDAVGSKEIYFKIIESGICIPGLELSSLNNNVHILGYGLDWRNPKLITFLKRQQNHRMNAIVKMCKKTNEFGIPVSVEEVLVEKQGDKGAVGRPHLAAAMLKKGYVSTVKEAFVKYLRKDAPIYEKKERHSHQFLIKKVLEWGGMPVLAHPGLIEEKIREKIIREAIEVGILGIEAYYPSHSEEYISQLITLASNNSLIITGGSDFHGENKPHIYLGIAGLRSEDFIIFSEKLAEVTKFVLKTPA